MTTTWAYIPVLKMKLYSLFRSFKLLLPDGVENREVDVQSRF